MKQHKLININIDFVIINYCVLALIIIIIIICCNVLIHNGFFCRQIHKHSLTEVFLVQTFPLYACITFGGYNIWNTLHVTDMSTAMSVKESETSSLCEWRQHPSTLHENNLPVLFNLHSSLPLFFPFFFALPPKLTQMRRHEIVISPRLCMKIKLGIAFFLDSLSCKQRSCFLIFM